MTHDDYLKLIRKSAAFQALSADMQQRILEAEGSLMQAYANIFFDEKKLLLDAQKNFLNHNEMILKNLTEEIKKLKNEKQKQEQQYLHTADEEEQQKLLSTMNQL